MPSSAKDRKPRELQRGRPLYDQQPDETEKAFQAFQTFRDLGVERTVSATARKLGKSRSIVKTWAGRWQWKKRVRAWDAKVDEQLRDEQLEAIREMRTRHIKIAKTMQGLGMNELGKHIKASRDNPDSSRVTATAAAALAEQGLRIERLNLGEPESVNAEVGREGMSWTDMVALSRDSADEEEDDDE